MLRINRFVGALVCVLTLASGATAGDISLSLNLEYNTFGDQSSGGDWTMVAKDQCSLQSYSSRTFCELSRLRFVVPLVSSCRHPVIGRFVDLLRPPIRKTGFEVQPVRSGSRRREQRSDDESAVEGNAACR